MLELRKHQAEAIKYILETAEGRDLVKMATGSGKTIIIIYVINEYLKAGKRALIIVHREHLIRQVVDRFAKFYPELSHRIGIVRGKERNWDKDIVVASVQTACRDLDIMHTDFDIVCTDEAHRAITPGYFSIYKRLGLINTETFSELFDKACKGDMKKSQKKKVFALQAAIQEIEADNQPRKHLGFTATPYRSDDLGLGSIFSGIAFDCGLRELIEENQLCDLSVLPIHFRLETADLRAMLRDGKADDKIVQVWKEYASERKHTIGFCMNISHAEHLAKTFRDAGIHAEALHSKLSADERYQREEAFRNGELPILTNVNVFIEGFDVEALDCIIFARDTDSATIIPQALGRGTRKYEGKNECFVIDMGGNIDVDQLSKEADIFRKIQIAGGGGGPGGFKGFREGREHPMLVQAIQLLLPLIENATDHYAWVPYVEKNGIALQISSDRWYCIGQQENGKYAASYDAGKKRRLVTRDKETITECKDACLKHMLDWDIRVAYSRRSEACQWRTELASDKQKGLLKRFGIDPSGDCTKGEASDMIATAFRNLS